MPSLKHMKLLRIAQFLRLELAHCEKYNLNFKFIVWTKYFHCFFPLKLPNCPLGASLKTAITDSSNSLFLEKRNINSVGFWRQLENTEWESLTLRCVPWSNSIVFLWEGLDNIGGIRNLNTHFYGRSESNLKQL